MLTAFEIDESRFELLNDYAKKKCYCVDQVCSIDYANYIYPQSLKKDILYINGFNLRIIQLHIEFIEGKNIYFFYCCCHSRFKQLISATKYMRFIA